VTVRDGVRGAHVLQIRLPSVGAGRRLCYLLTATLVAVCFPTATAHGAGAGSCPRLASPTGSVIDVSPAQAGRLADIVAGAPAGATIRLADGKYSVGTITMSRPGVTLRSASGHPRRVVLDGGYGPSALIHPFANNLTVAEITLRRARDHLVHAYPAADGPGLRGLRLYRVLMVDSGEQFLKVNSNAARSAWVDSGTVACSEFLMTPSGRANIERAFGCYTGGIDVHSGRGWRVRDSAFEGIYCEDGELAEHAIHFWKGARATVVENNVIENCARAIGFGLGDTGEGRPWADDPYPGVGYVGHYDGVIRGNAVLADISQYDTGIELAQARGTRVLHNTVVETARATASFSSLDYRWPNTMVEVANNLTRRITGRDGGRAALSHNVEATPRDWLVDPLGGDFHLRPGLGGAIDRGVAVNEAGLDIDGRGRDYGGAPDIGADEWSPAASKSRLGLRLRGVRRVGGRYTARRTKVFRVIGRLRPRLAGQRFTISFRRGRRTTRVKARTGSNGNFAARYRPLQGGWITIRATHRQTAALDAVRSRRVRVLVR
jgi:hypothetical protein